MSEQQGVQSAIPANHCRWELADDHYVFMGCKDCASGTEPDPPQFNPEGKNAPVIELECKLTDDSSTPGGPTDT